MDDLLREFLTETNESLDVVDIELVRFEQEPNNAEILANIFRLVHTIKGTCGFIGLPRLETLAHAAEALMGKFRDGAPATSEAVTIILATIDRIKAILASLDREQREPEGSDADLIAELQRMAEAVSAAPAPVGRTVGTLTGQVLERPLRPGENTLDELERAFRETAVEPPRKTAASPTDSPAAGEEPGRNGSQSIRVTVDTLEQLMTMVSELVLTRNQLLEIVRRHEDSEFKAPLQRLSNVTAELQDGVMKTRMQPIGNAWQKLPRIVRDLCTELGKDIDLEMHGAETELDRQVLDLIKDPLTHMVRNSADHGLEPPEERRAAGKPERGRIRLSAYHEGGFIVIQISDDGRGLDTARIKAKAIAQGLATEAELEKLTEAQIHKFIFQPGFSTAAKITSISGRGVGMDVVRNNVDQIGGTIDVKSVAGVGLSFTVKIPLTLAIIAALIVEAGGEHFAIPQLAVVELVRARNCGDHRIERIRDTLVLRLRDRLVPLARLTHLLGMEAPGGEIDRGYIVVTQVGSQLFGIAVDAVFHTEEIVVKPMSSKLRHISMFSGNTILGDGSVIMIVDPNGIARALGSTASAQMAQTATESAASENAGEEQSTSLLVFRAGSAQPKAVPLALVTRLEEVDARTIELSNGRHMVQYRGQLMPVVSMNEAACVKSEGAQPLLVFSDGPRSMALVVDEIVDIVDDRLDIQVTSGTPGVLGSAIVKGQATEIIDVGHFLPLAFEDWFRRKEPGATRRQSVLLVDDSPFFRNMLTPVLQAAGYAVTAVGSAEAALDLIRIGQTFDVAITDVEMPGMNGFEFAEALRADPRTAALPVIGLSSAISAEAIERGREAGFHDYVAKFDRQGLIASLKEQSDVGRAA